MLLDYKDRGARSRLVYEAMKAAGVDAEAIFSAMGVPLEQVLAPEYTYPHRLSARFWELAEQISEDPDVGLRAGLHHPVYRGQVLRYLHQSSPTFGEGLRRVLAYQRLLSDAQVLRLECPAHTSYLAFVSKIPEIDHLRHASECMLCGWVRYLREMTENDFIATKVEFSCSPPAQVERREQIFGCRVRYDAPENRIYFDSALLTRPSPDAEPELFRLHERIAAEHLQRITRQDFVDAVRRRIGALLESGEAKPERVAVDLGLNESQLAVRLAELQTSFARELDICRCHLAKHLLAHTDESIGEICYLTHFSEPSAFYRAFKRWCGERPIQYRDRKRAGQASLAQSRGVAS